jgi:peroxiredoxin
MTGVGLSTLVLLLSAVQVRALHVGDSAPDFTLPATTADKLSLADYRGKQNVVVFFYIAAFGRS